MSGKEMEELTKLLPEGWQEKAKELKALRRAGDYIKTPDELLRIILLWSEIGSFGATSAFLRATGDYPLAKNAVRERVRGSVDWLEWLVTNFCRNSCFLAEMPSWLEGKRVLVADATNVSKPGSKRSDYRLHYLMELFSLATVEQYLTDGKTGESAANFSLFRAGDILIADRAYGTLKGLRSLREHGADCLLRMKANAFKVYSEAGDGYEEFDLTAELSRWEEGRTVDLALCCKDGEKMYPIRVCARAKTKDEIAAGLRQIKKSNRGKNRTKVTELQSVYNRYVVLMTTLPASVSAERILELYRMRWQVELVFKRMKTLLKYDQLQGMTNVTARAWFYSKLLVAAFCEYFLNQASFSPEDARREQAAALLLAGIRFSLPGDLSSSPYFV